MHCLFVAHVQQLRAAAHGEATRAKNACNLRTKQARRTKKHARIVAERSKGASQAHACNDIIHTQSHVAHHNCAHEKMWFHFFAPSPLERFAPPPRSLARTNGGSTRGTRRCMQSAMSCAGRHVPAKGRKKKTMNEARTRHNTNHRRARFDVSDLALHERHVLDASLLQERVHAVSFATNITHTHTHARSP